MNNFDLINYIITFENLALDKNDNQYKFTVLSKNPIIKIHLYTNATITLIINYNKTKIIHVRNKKIKTSSEIIKVSKANFLDLTFDNPDINDTFTLSIISVKIIIPYGLFDWIKYINTYKLNTINTKDKAWAHWCRHGNKEFKIPFILDFLNSYESYESKNINATNDCIKTNNINASNDCNINKNNILSDDKYYDAINDFISSYKCKKNDVLKDPKIEFRYFCFKYLDVIRNLVLPEITLNNKYEAVLIEYRCFPHLEFLIRNTIHKLGKDWSHTIICGNLNYEYIKTMCSKISEKIKIIKTNYDNLDQLSYSRYLTTLEFWNLLVGEKILIYQEDSCMFRTNINDFIKWDYIGAPWPKSRAFNIQGVGNGGFSLRTKECMIRVIINSLKKNKCFNSIRKKIIEDIYISTYMINNKIGRVADWNNASLFSSELIFNPQSLGGHNFWLGNKEWKQFLYDKLINQSL